MRRHFTVLMALLLMSFSYSFSQTSLTYDFDTDLEGWTSVTGCSYTTDWRWDTDNGAGAAYFPQPYGSSSAYLKSPQINVLGSSSITLSYNHRWYTESCCDHGYVAYRLDGGSWQQFYPSTGSYTGTDGQYYDPLFGSCGTYNTQLYYGNYSTYTTHSGSININGAQYLEIAFVYTSDGSINYDGWFINSVTVDGLIPPTGFNVALTDIVSPQIFGLGNNFLTVEFQNIAADSVVWLDLGYQVDNNTPVLVNDHYPMSGDTLWAGDKDTFTFPTPINLTSKGSYTLKVWVANANDQVPDDRPADDTLFVSFCTGMSGTYTIGASSSADYGSVTAAINALKQCGISGPVLFEFEKGSYNERVELEEISGMSQINTVTFDGLDKDDVTIQHSSTSSTARATILFDGADYFTFKNLTIKATGSYATALHFMNGANYNTVMNCHLEVPIQGSTNYNVIIASSSESSYSGTGDNGFYNTFDNCLIKGGYYGVRWNGLGSSTSPKTNYDNHFINSTWEDQYYYLYYSYYCGGHNISYNIMNQPTYDGGYSIYNYYGAEDTITSNYIEPGRYGISQYYYNNRYNNGSSLIANNIIMNFKNKTYQTGIYCYYYAYKQMIYNNTVWVDGSASNTRDYSALWMYYPYDSEVKNNIFISTGGTMLTSYYYPQGNWDVDYNQYDYQNMTGTYVFYGYPYTGTTSYKEYHTDFDSWLGFDDPTYMDIHDENSWNNEVIHFVSNTDLHLDSRYPALMGDKVGLVDDIDGDPRCKFETAIGADETQYSTGLPTSLFVSEDTLCFGTPIIFANTASEEAKQGYTWYHNGKKVSNDHNWTWTFDPGTYDDTISLITENCTGFDTFTKIVHIDTPQTAPIADFIADENIVETSFPVQFYDISQNCPDNWYWIINPDSIFDPAIGFKMPSVTYLPPTFATSQNPWISFDYPGSYDICLVAANIKGADTICKEDYIVVKPSQWMCQYVLPSVSKSLFGFLFDDGGPFSDYANSVNCNLLLDPCASQLSIKFTEFNFASGDYLRLYDGSDNTGTPMWDVNAYGTTGLTGNMANAAFDTVFHSQSGKIYIELETNASGQAAGFQAEWFGVKGNFAKPTADFIVNDTVCYNQEVAFMDNSIGDDLTYSWDFDMDGFVDATGENPTWTYNLWGPMKYTVELNVENCGGNSSKKKTIDVIQPNDAPTPDFEANILRPVAGEDNVTFTDLSYASAANPYGCADQWAWDITPRTYVDQFGLTVPAFTYVMGTDSSSQNPVVRFNDTGYYDVKLIVYYNSNGKQTIKSDYIYAIQYCRPGITNLNPDLGISHVMLADIDNSSQIGKEAYTDFSNTASTPIDLQGTYTLTVERNSTYNEMNRAVWIDWDVDGEYESSELIGTENNAKTLSWSVNFTVPANAPQGATRMRIATSLGGTPNTDPCATRAFGEVEDYRVIIRPDGTPPEITIIGLDTVYLEQCDCGTYVDSGATAMDNIDGTLSVTTTNNFDCTKDGQYWYKYSATDNNNNEGVAERVIIVNPDMVIPELTLNGKLIDTIDVYTSWTDPGYTADDTCAGLDRVDIMGMVDTAKLGSYDITYTAYDMSTNQNMTSATRTVVVVDRIDPTINLNGFSVMNVEVYHDYVDPGVSYSDNYCPVSSIDYTVKGMVDNTKLGSYVLTYSVTDCNGNGPVDVTRTVIVTDTTKPTIVSDEYKDGETITLEVNNTLPIPAMTISDNYDKSPDVSYSGTFYTDFPTFYADELGSYTLTVTVTDGEGNQSMITWNIEVVDIEAPVISLTGDKVLNLCRWDELADYDDYTITDNYYTGLTATIGGTYFDEYLVDYYIGFFTITYDVKDGSNNDAEQIVRYVNVDNCASGIEESESSISINVYPNPTTGLFTVDINIEQSEDVEVIVTNTLGQVVDYIELDNVKAEQYQVDLSAQSAGVYMVKVQTDNESIIKRITLTK